MVVGPTKTNPARLSVRASATDSPDVARTASALAGRTCRSGAKDQNSSSSPPDSRRDTTARAFVIGDRVRGGLYSEYPSLAPVDWLNGEDLRHTFDFRGVYSTMLEQWLGLDPHPIVGGAYEQLPIFTPAAA